MKPVIKTTSLLIAISILPVHVATAETGRNTAGLGNAKVAAKKSSSGNSKALVKEISRLKRDVAKLKKDLKAIKSQAAPSSGPVGPHGVQGLQGPAGTQGSTGPQGPSGVVPAVANTTQLGFPQAEGKLATLGPEGVFPWNALPMKPVAGTSDDGVGTVTAKCLEDDQIALGGGAEVTTPNKYLKAVYPNNVLKPTGITAKTDVGANITAYVFCAEMPVDPYS